MYRHLLVPLDGSTLATELVRQAVLLAKSLGASITFFHAQEDYGSTSVSDMIGGAEMSIAHRRRLVVLLHVPGAGRLAEDRETVREAVVRAGQSRRAMQRATHLTPHNRGGMP